MTILFNRLDRLIQLKKVKNTVRGALLHLAWSTHKIFLPELLGVPVPKLAFFGCEIEGGTCPSVGGTGPNSYMSNEV